MSNLPAEVIDNLRSADREVTPELTRALMELFAPLHEANDYRAPEIERDLVYGPDPRNRLDLHTAREAGSSRPVVLFVHGGGFVSGDKSDPALPYYDNVGGWAVRHGMVAVTMTYRLAPQNKWPAAAEDIASAIAWTREHAGDFGGDPDKIVLIGHSAGGAHVSSFVAGHAGTDPADIAGAVMLSGIYDPPTAEQNALLHAYYGDDPEKHVEQSALSGLVASDVPMLFGAAEFDVPHFHQQAAVLIGAMREARDAVPLFVTVPDHTHLSEIFSLGLDEDALGTTLARFIHRATSDRQASAAGSRR
ncbi:alpha/beta hydrolase [Nocardia abscessus]|uniref:alpha/beta hydrolase n=1 Tax=Nocardia abscessus TaxID=120957 RepID=UPI00030CEFC8|nr:alpha/beta hydrolase [Nocardia abscessus]MCC3332193.1 alpha/beta hydrolase [Nocardia abscessus]